MRSQLDAQDSRLPGTGVFDIKTRAAVAIRYDPLNYRVRLQRWKVPTLMLCYRTMLDIKYGLITASLKASRENNMT
jgi:hypothetical protein